MISTATSNILCFLLSGTYVIGLYLIPARITNLPYDNTLQIRYRLAVTCFSNVLSILLLAYFYTQLTVNTDLAQLPFLHAIGIRLDTAVASICYTVALMAMFYLGPLACYVMYTYKRCYYNIDSYGEQTIKEDGLAGASSNSNNNNNENDNGNGNSQNKGSILSMFPICIQDIRDYCAVSLMSPEIALRALFFAPISEELIVRAGLVLIMASSGSSISVSGSQSNSNTFDSWYIAARCPLWFGIAHIHHAYTQWKDGTQGEAQRHVNKGVLLKRIFVHTMAKTTYTSIFGYMAVLLYLRSGNLIAPIVAHMICNWVQLPNIAFMSLNSSPYSCMYTFRWLLGAAHIAGLVLFSMYVIPFSAVMANAGDGSGSPLWKE